MLQMEVGARRAFFGKGAGVIPPIHPNCKCKLIAIENKAKYVHNINKNGFIREIKRLLGELPAGSGGIYILSANFIEGSGGWLTTLDITDYSSLSGGENNRYGRYKKLG
ncbi:MAG: hypothetical protein GX488_01775 [Clostridiales bacterium]|nr:hypothetical protein [Clostridiales bacterium]